MKIDIDNITAVKQVPAGIGGFDQTYTVKAHVDGEPKHVVIAVDWEALATMLSRACLSNSTGKSRLANGNIRAWVRR